MYFGLCFSIAEMSPALPHTGGAYSFARSAMGPWGGFTTGVAETIEYVVTPAVIVFGIGSYMDAISEDLFGGSPGTWAWWLIFYIVFVGLNIVGVKESFQFTVFICLASLAILAVFFVGAIPKLDFNEYAIGDQGWFPDGVPGVFYAFPFAIWFYLAIEELPLAAEESHFPHRDIPRGTIYGLLTLIVTGAGILFLNSGIAPGSDPSDFPAGYGIFLPKGSKIIFQMHYHKEPGPGTAVYDQSSVAMRFAKDPVQRLYVSAAYADQGTSFKRVRPAPMGRAFRVVKRTAHLTVQVAERPEKVVPVAAAGETPKRAARRPKAASASRASGGAGRRPRSGKTGAKKAKE